MHQGIPNLVIPRCQGQCAGLNTLHSQHSIMLHQKKSVDCGGMFAQRMRGALPLY